MKTLNFLRSRLSTPLSISALALSLTASAGELPLISPPLPELLEGTYTELSQDQLAETAASAETTKSLIEDLLGSLQGLGKVAREQRLIEGLQQIVVKSAPKNSETFMRFTINRALKVRDVLARETAPGSIDGAIMRLRLLEQSIQLALDFYPQDMKRAESEHGILAYAQFGIRYSGFLSNLMKSYFDSSAQYQVARLVVGFLQWDLARDLSSQDYAVEIHRLNSQYTQMPDVSPPTTAIHLTEIQNVVGLLRRLNLSDKILLPGLSGLQSLKTRVSNEYAISERDIYILPTGNSGYEFIEIISHDAAALNIKAKFLSGPEAGTIREFTSNLYILLQRALYMNTGCDDVVCVSQRIIYERDIKDFTGRSFTLDEVPISTVMARNSWGSSHNLLVLKQTQKASLIGPSSKTLDTEYTHSNYYKLEGSCGNEFSIGKAVRVRGRSQSAVIRACTEPTGYSDEFIVEYTTGPNKGSLEVVTTNAMN